MKSLNLFFSLALLMPTAVSAQTFAERAQKTYLETDKTFDIDCNYSYNKTFKLITPVSQTTKGANTISRDFLIETDSKKIPMRFVLERTPKSIEYVVTLNNSHVSRGRVQKREFYIAPVADRSFSQEFEANQIYCEVNFAYAEPYSLQDGDYHFSVHPHKIYDWQSKLKKPIEAYLNDPSYKSIILLETGNYRGNLVNIHSFLDGIDYKLPETKYDSDLEDVPLEIPLIVSPAGNNRFIIDAKKELNITFTGGNHNYCIWNGARHVLEGLFRSHNNPKVNFIYDTKAIVAQTRGIEGLRLNFSRSDVNKSNLLVDLLDDKNTQSSYHFVYLSYFKNFMAREFSGMYRTYKIKYDAPGFSTEETIQGNGLKDIEVTFNYR